MTSIAERWAEVDDRVAAAARARRVATRADVRIVAATKTVPRSRRSGSSLAAGCVDLGENRAQELLAKAPELVDGPASRWHFLGPLQRNKVQRARAVGRRAGSRSTGPRSCPARRATGPRGHGAGRGEPGRRSRRRPAASPAEVARARRRRPGRRPRRGRADGGAAPRGGPAPLVRGARATWRPTLGLARAVDGHERRLRGRRRGGRHHRPGRPGPLRRRRGQA